MVIPDTNVLIAYFSSKENLIVSMLDKMLEKQKVLFSVVAVAEFLVKAQDEEQKIMERMIAENSLIPIDAIIMKQAVRYRKQTLRKSRRILMLDCFIAATARIHKATLLTFDRRDYPFSDIKVRQPEEIIASSYEWRKKFPKGYSS